MIKGGPCGPPLIICTEGFEPTIGNGAQVGLAKGALRPQRSREAGSRCAASAAGFAAGETRFDGGFRTRVGGETAGLDSNLRSAMAQGPRLRERSG